MIVLGNALVLLFYYANAVLETIRFRAKAPIGNDAFLFECSHRLSSSAQIIKSRPKKIVIFLFMFLKNLTVKVLSLFLFSMKQSRRILVPFSCYAHKIGKFPPTFNGKKQKADQNKIIIICSQSFCGGSTIAGGHVVWVGRAASLKFSFSTSLSLQIYEMKFSPSERTEK